jgi:hypothetical protein
MGDWFFVGGSTPGLLLGLAGIGHFFLRLTRPEVPSVLLFRPHRAGIFCYPLPAIAARARL